MIDGFTIRDERFRYTMRNEGRAGEELYSGDPMGMKNMAANPAMELTKFQLRTALNGTTLTRGRLKLPGEA